jgi:hypothetical protein
MNENRRYLIIPTSIIQTINFDEVYETSSETLRLSTDGNWTFIKYDLPTRPSIYSEEYNEYTHTQMLEILSTPEWTQQEKFIGE